MTCVDDRRSNKGSLCTGLFSHFAVGWLGQKRLKLRSSIENWDVSALWARNLINWNTIKLVCVYYPRGTNKKLIPNHLKTEIYIVYYIRFLTQQPNLTGYIVLVTRCLALQLILIYSYSNRIISVLYEQYLGKKRG